MQKCRYTFKESKNIGVTYLILSELSWAGMGRSQASAFRIVRGVVSVGSGLGALDTGHLLSAASTIGPGNTLLYTGTGNYLEVLKWWSCLVSSLDYKESV